MEHFTKKLNQRKAAASLRSLKTAPAHSIDFCSNDYLGFADKLNHASENLAAGSKGSRLLKGNHAIHETVEEMVAQHHGVPAALLFNSGYSANVGLISTISERNHIILYDELCHASMRDGIQLSHAKAYAFKHNNLQDLQAKLNKWPSDVVWVLTESVFSMDGDQAPLEAMVDLCEKHGANLIVDEAHALGVFGTKGAGLVQALKLENKVFARVVTFGKALGCHGAAILGDDLLKQYLINFCRAFIYTTALPPSSVHHIKQGYALLCEATDQQMLQNNIQLFKQQLHPSINIIASESAIQCVVISGNEQAKKAAASLQQQGLDVRPILSPTVPAGQERLRICLHSFNTPSEITQLTQALHALHS